MSGSLGKKPATPTSGKKNPTVRVEVVVGNGSPQTMSQVMDRVIRATQNFKPQDVKSVQNLLRQRTSLLKGFMRDAGVSVMLTYVVNEPVDITRINWS